MENDNNNQQDLPSFKKDQLNQLKQEEENRKQWRKEMEENVAIQAYFNQFTESSVKDFIESYFVYKNLWVTYGKNYVERMHSDGVKWVEKAQEYLKMILQKKLFDLQCQWRAGNIELPQVEICFDFRMWEENILNCPFIEPITPDDIVLMQQFLNSGDVQTELGWFNDWQDYEELKEAYNTDNANRNFPEWYDFYNGRRGTSVYMILPDIKGEREKFYMNLYRENKQAEKQTENTDPQPPVVSKPYISFYDKKNTEWFVNTFENKEIRELYKGYEWSNRSDDDRERLESDLDTLFDADEYVPIDANMDWKEGVRIAAQKYRLSKIANALPEAYEQYCMNLQMGIAFGLDEHNVFSAYEEIRQEWREKIIEGRKLNGEPDDLDF